MYLLVTINKFISLQMKYHLPKANITPEMQIYDCKSFYFTACPAQWYFCVLDKYKNY